MSELQDTVIRAELGTLEQVLNKVLENPLDFGGGDIKDIDLDREKADEEAAKTAANMDTALAYGPAAALAVIAEDQRCRRDVAIAKATRRELLLGMLTAGYGRAVYLKNQLEEKK